MKTDILHTHTDTHTHTRAHVVCAHEREMGEEGGKGGKETER